MAEFEIKSDSVDVKRVMEQIRQRIREKRGVDYTKQQIHELAAVKLEKFLDPKCVRSNLVEHLQRRKPPPLALFEFDEDTVYASSRGQLGQLIRLIRRLARPLVKMLFNPDPIVFALERQVKINERFVAREESHEELLNYEVLNNLVVELTRLSIDLKNHKMHVESVAGRLDFAERRVRALESVVQSLLPRSIKGAEVQDGDDASSSGSSRSLRRRRRSGSVTSTDPRVDDG